MMWIFTKQALWSENQDFPTHFEEMRLREMWIVEMKYFRFLGLSPAAGDKALNRALD
jgi:hypothetical protein